MAASPVIIQGTLVNDPIHGPIMLHPLCVKIIDTPQFQRLRRLKQLGSTYFVYPGASHNRFEHSIGVCHLAGKFVELLKADQPDLPITEEDILCVKIAGLCHDLGHGPFSHLFESIVKEIRAERNEEEWQHEQASLKLLDYLIKENDLMKEFKKWKLEPEDIEFIKRVIHKDAKESDTGRGVDKEFLYQIVANDTNGLDVDKWDYFARDCHMLGIKNNFDHLRCMQLARVCDVEGENRQICFRDKEEFNISDMFHTRYTLHKRAYKHKTSLVIDVMISDALKAANSHYKKFVVESKDKPLTLTMSQSVDNMEAYTNLTDDVLYDIRLSTEDTLQKSRDIINRIVKRDLYKCLVIKTVETKVTEKEEKNALKDALKNDLKDALKDALEDAMKNAPEDALEGSRKNALEDALGNALKNALKDALEDALEDDLKNGLEDELKNALKDALKKALKDALREARKDALKKALKNALKNALEDARSDERLLDEFEIKIAKFDYSKGNEDPVDYVRFFHKDNPTKGVKRTPGGRMNLKQPLCQWDILVLYKGSGEISKDKIENIETAIDVLIEVIKVLKELLEGICERF